MAMKQETRQAKEKEFIMRPTSWHPRVAVSPGEQTIITQIKRADEALLIELRKRQQTPEGRATLRKRTAVKHTLAHVGRWQGRRARYRGTRKNLFDLRRCALVHNVHVLARSQQFSAKFQSAA
jgi:hypothetical protein